MAFDQIASRRRPPASVKARLKGRFPTMRSVAGGPSFKVVKFICYIQHHHRQRSRLKHGLNLFMTISLTSVTLVRGLKEVIQQMRSHEVDICT